MPSCRRCASMPGTAEPRFPASSGEAWGEAGNLRKTLKVSNLWLDDFQLGGQLMARGRRKSGVPKVPKAETYRHPEAEAPLRPEVGTQAQFKKKKPPRTYRYDSSLSPALDWDGQNYARELGEWLLARLEEAAALPAPHLFDKPRELRQEDGTVVASVRGLADAVEQLKRLSQPFLNWAGKAERLSFEVPTLPLFIHERLSTKGIIETLKGHRQSRMEQMDLFGDPQHPVIDQVLRAYEYRDKWVNRLILGDSLVVMNSLLHYEGLGGQVQMIYLDPPYGIKFGSNFQPFVRKRDVKHNDDEDLTREPEMVQAYRDTWELGLHSYLSYLRDRLLLCRDLLTPSGSILVQIGDDNLHHMRELMDELFGRDNFCSLVTFQKTTSATSDKLSAIADYLLWYSKDSSRMKFRPVYLPRIMGAEGTSQYIWVELSNGDYRRLTPEELSNPESIPTGSRIFAADNTSSARGAGPGEAKTIRAFGRDFTLTKGSWKTAPDGFARLEAAGRLIVIGNSLMYRRYFNDFSAIEVANIWRDTLMTGFSEPKLYAVQTSQKVIERCILMTTDPGDLVLDPTCGSGTTAYVAEQWGRRWITVDVSRVPLALARQRLLTATFPYYGLKDEARGPAGGFVYQRKQNKKGEEVGGIVPHITLKSIANNEPPAEEVLVDRPEVAGGITRVSGPFCVEATIPAPLDWEEDRAAGPEAPPEEHGALADRMLEVLRKSPVLHVGGGKTVTLRNVRPPAKTLSLSAEALVPSDGNGEGDLDMPTLMKSPLLASGPAGRPVALVFGPENGAVSEKLVYEAAREAHGKQYTHLFVIGFAIQPNARKLVEDCDAAMGIAATYIQATPDLMMGDLLKNMRSSQIFSVCGLPEIKLTGVPAAAKGEPEKYQVQLLGLDVFDPATMETVHRRGDDVPAWFLDTDYNGLCFHVCQAFFPRTGAWESLKKALKGLYEDSVWDHLAGTVSAPFEAGEHGQVAVKVIDDRGNELLVVQSLKEAAT
jgi:adenine-specific DNA-methyltransferase